MATKTKRKSGKTTKRTASKGKVGEVVKMMTAKRTAKRTANAKRNTKQPYQGKKADYLYAKVAEAHAMPAIAKSQVRTSPHTVRVDMREVVEHLTPNLWKRPDLTMNARLLGIKAIWAEAGKVGYLRLLVNSKTNPDINPDNDDAYMVLLYRRTK